MTLDELEKFAQECVGRGGVDYSELEMNDLAQIILAIMPMLKAVPKWRSHIAFLARPNDAEVALGVAVDNTFDVLENMKYELSYDNQR